ncbi:MAG: peptide deformylase [Actinomycetota bacterium]|nr:peptide deformylase [Actinomycetota bacterium]
MAVLPIRLFGDPVLRTPAREVERLTDDHHRLIENMLETMREAPGVGLAGPQVGILERIFVWEVEENHGAFVNPKITRRSTEMEDGEEGCLSIPGLYYPVARSIEIDVEALDENGEPVSLTAEGFFARVCQHEIDHLDGVLFLDRLAEDVRREAMRELREQVLGIAPAHPREREPVEEQL